MHFNLKIILLVFLGVILILSIRFAPKDAASLSSQDIDTYIVSQMNVCSSEGGSTNCLREIAQDFTSKFELPQILAVFQKNQSRPEFFAYCHATVHFIGQESFKKIFDLPQALSQCSPGCFEGCYHGVLEGYLESKNIALDDDEGFKREIPIACGQRENSQKEELYNECVHGLGHALMYLTEGDLPRSLKSCDYIKDSYDQTWCYSGVFMENSTSSTNKDHPSKYLKANDPFYPCNILEERYLDSCYTLQTFYIAQISNYQTDKIIDFCHQVPTKYQVKCFGALGQVQVGATQDMSQIKFECDKIGDKANIDHCYDNALGALSSRYGGEATKLIEFCSVVDQANKPTCYSRLGFHMTRWFESKDQLRTVCQEIYDKQFMSECLAGG